MERYVGLLAEVPSVFTPGATYSYCNKRQMSVLYGYARKITWLIGATRWIRGTGVHRINHVARIHHANPAADRAVTG